MLELYSLAVHKYCMVHWFVRIHRTSEDPFNFPHFGKVQYFRTELMFHRFAIVEHPDYPGPYRARFIAAHSKESMISFVALKYTDIQFEYHPLNGVKI